MKRKKFMAVVLAAVMTMSMAMTVCAADGSGGSESNVSTSSSSKKTTKTTVVMDQEDGGSGSMDAGEVSSVDMSRVVSASTAVLVAGQRIQTTVAGAYLVNKLSGVAVITPAAELQAKLNLSSGQTAYVMAFDLDAKKSSLAMTSIQMAAEALGADFVAAINVNLGAKQNGKMVTLSDGSVNMVVGLPKTEIDPAKTYSVVRVAPGGLVTYYNDLDTNSQTVTFEVNAGIGAYAILAK